MIKLDGTRWGHLRKRLLCSISVLRPTIPDRLIFQSIQAPYPGRMIDGQNSLDDFPAAEHLPQTQLDFSYHNTDLQVLGNGSDNDFTHVHMIRLADGINDAMGNVLGLNGRNRR